MTMLARRLLCVLVLLAALSATAQRSRSASAPPADASMTKGQEVETVGTGPYLGPLPEELEKLAQVEAAAAAAPLPEKGPAVVTLTPSRGDTLTAAEQAKLASFLASPVPLVTPEMMKLGTMQVPTTGVSQLTAQEREKHEHELAAPPAQPAVAAPPAQGTNSSSKTGGGTDTPAQSNSSGNAPATHAAPRSQR